MKTRALILLGSIFLLGFILRAYRLTSVPLGFFCDEADIGHTAYQILTTGKDRSGTFLPWSVVSGVNGGRNPLPIYLTIPFVAAFGLNEFAVRFTNAVLGIAGIWLFYRISRAFWNTRVSLVASLLFAIAPWYLFFNRVGWEQTSWIVMTLFVLDALVYRKIFSFFVYAAFAFYTYHPAWLTTPFLVVFAVLWWGAKEWRWTRVLSGSIVFFLILLPLVVGIIRGNALGRASQIQASHPNTSPTSIVTRYASYFSPDFLFLKGDIDYPGNRVLRHSVRGMGQLYLFQLPLILMGIVVLIYRVRWKTVWILFFLCAYPIAGVFSGEVVSTRSVIGIVPFTLLTVAGFSYFWKNMKKGRMGAGIAAVLVVAFSLFGFLHEYFLVYPTYASGFWGWQYGPREVIRYAREVSDEYDEAYMVFEANAPDIFLPFYTVNFTKGCVNCRMGGLERYSGGKRQLFALSESASTKAVGLPLRLVYTVRYQNGTVAYRLFASDGSIR